MKIGINSSSGLTKVIEPHYDSQDIYLDNDVIRYLEKEGKLNELEKMQFSLSFSTQQWEISDAPPVGTPGTIASVIFSIGGTLKFENADKVICALS
jgi:hypothetical protein